MAIHPWISKLVFTAEEIVLLASVICLIAFQIIIGQGVLQKLIKGLTMVLLFTTQIQQMLLCRVKYFLKIFLDLEMSYYFGEIIQVDNPPFLIFLIQVSII